MPHGIFCTQEKQKVGGVKKETEKEEKEEERGEGGEKIHLLTHTTARGVGKKQKLVFGGELPLIRSSHRVVTLGQSDGTFYSKCNIKW